VGTPVACKQDRWWKSWTNTKLDIKDGISDMWLLQGCWRRQKWTRPRPRPRAWGRGQSQNCINFFRQILHFDPIFSKKANFRSIFEGTSKMSAHNGSNMATLLVNTPKTTSYAFGRRLYCFCVYTLNRKWHILSVNITKQFNSTSQTTRPRGQVGRGRGHNCHEAEVEASFLDLDTAAGTKT